MTNQLTLDLLKDAVTGSAAAFRCVSECQPAGGVWGKVMSLARNGGKYVTERRQGGGKWARRDDVGQGVVR